MRSGWLAVSCALLLAAAFAGSPGARAQATDPHALYEERCTRCHASHAGDFVAESLVRRDDRIVGRASGADVRSFLEGGHGGLAAVEVDVMVAHLTAVLDSAGLFRRKCLICHDRAVVLARRELIRRNGRIFGRYTGRDIETFLGNHGRLGSAQIDTIVRMLGRQLVGQSGK